MDKCEGANQNKVNMTNDATGIDLIPLIKILMKDLKKELTYDMTASRMPVPNPIRKPMEIPLKVNNILL